MAEVMAVDGGHRSERELAPIMKDEVLDEGVRIAKGIGEQASSFGRRRAQRDTTGELARHTSATPP